MADQVGALAQHVHPGRQQLGTLEHLEVRVMQTDLDPSLAVAAAALTFLISAREPWAHQH